MAWRNEYADSLHKVLIDTPGGTIECVGGSYAGIPFFVASSEKTGGRVIITKAIPFSDKHVNEDGGKKVSSFSFSIFLLGVDVESKREALEDAFDKEGYFELVHPQYGRFNARCSEYTVPYKSETQEYIEIPVTFIPEQDPKETANSVEDLGGLVLTKSNAVLDSSNSNFKNSFSIVGKARSIVNSVAGFSSNLLDTIESARASVRSVSEFVNTISRIKANIELAMMSPADFSSRLQQLLTQTKEVFGLGSNDYVRESLSMVDYAAAKRRSTPFASADDLIGYINRLVLMSAAAMAVRSIVDCRFDSAEEAREMQDAVCASFSAAAETVDSIDDYADLMDMQAAALKYLRNEMSSLAVVVDLPMNGSRDVLSTCFDCYGSLDRVEDILSRNGICDPLVITPRNLKVLSK